MNQKHGCSLTFTILHEAEVMLATAAIVGILFKKDPATWKVAHNQLRIIHSRMTAAGIRPQLSKVWNTIWAGLAPVDYASKQKFEVCAAIGCVTQDTFAPMLCSRCRVTFYCSQACQKSYVPVLMESVLRFADTNALQRLEATQA